MWWEVGSTEPRDTVMRLMCTSRLAQPLSEDLTKSGQTSGAFMRYWVPRFLPIKLVVVTKEKGCYTGELRF